MLLDSGVDINERDRDGSTALHLAIQMRQDAIIRLLLERGALTSVKDSRGKTPTHLAIYSNFETGLKILLDHDASVEKRK
jgi:ankyrin repeat protein